MMAVDADEHVTTARIDFLVPDLEVVRCLNKDIKVLAWKARLRLLERGRNRVPEHFRDGGLGDIDRGGLDCPTRPRRRAREGYSPRHD